MPHISSISICGSSCNNSSIVLIIAVVPVVVVAAVTLASVQIILVAAAGFEGLQFNAMVLRTALVCRQCRQGGTHPRSRALNLQRPRDRALFVTGSAPLFGHCSRYTSSQLENSCSTVIVSVFAFLEDCRVFECLNRC